MPFMVLLASLFFLRPGHMFEFWVLFALAGIGDYIYDIRKKVVGKAADAPTD